MFPIRISAFSGERPGIDVHLLPENGAQVARNVDLSRGVIRGARSAAQTGVALAANIRSIFKYNPSANGGQGFWFSSSQKLSFVRGPIADDPYLRTYFGGPDIFPRITTNAIATQGDGPYPSNWFTLGVPAPSAVPAVIPAVGTPPPGTTAFLCSYVVTYVTALGEEGPPSFPSINNNRWDGATTLVGFSDLVPSNRNITMRRIYRADDTGEFLYLGELPIATPGFADTVLRADAGLPISTVNYDPPPEGMQGFVEMPNGVFAGFKDNTLYFCEPYLPHAWPIDYRIALTRRIIGVVMGAAGLLVCCEGKPAIIVGAHPSAFRQADIDEVRPCTAPGGIVDMGQYMVYPSADGLVAMGGSDLPTITDGFIDRDTWAGIVGDGSSFIACRFDNAYLAFYSAGSFIFRPGLGFRFFEATADAIYVDDISDKVYVKSGTELRLWDQGAERLPWRWRSRVWTKIVRAEYRWCKVRCNVYPVYCQVYYDGVLAHQQWVVSGDPFRLPRGRSQTAEVELSGAGTAECLDVQLVTHTKELV